MQERRLGIHHASTPRPVDGNRKEHIVPFNGKRRLPVGAELLDGGAHFRVWAAGTRQVELVLAPGDAGGRERTIALEPESAGYFSVFLPDMRAGVLYGFRLDGRGPFPDPASRFQPDGPHGPSELIDPSFPWTDAGWSGPELKGQVFYELHVGTFTHEGNWSAATRHLPRLAQLGITTVEVMPVADFAGRFGWGYDGVNLFAPTRLYGRPEEFRRFIDVAHSLGLAVILDVVYNHLGPDGNYLAEFSPAYFNRHYRTAWGDAINFDGEDSGPVREYFLANAEYWVREFHLDGFRLDATQEIYDESGDHIVAALVRRVRQAAAGRATLVIAENEKQEVKLVQHPEEGGYGVDGLWNDDFHHSARVAVTGRSEGYYTDFLGSSQELVSAVKWGYLFQGQYYHWLQQRRGSPTFGLPPHIFVSYLENHDQIANSRSGERLHQIANPGQLRALTSLLLLGPGTPLLFQGQEFGASSPFVFFADHGGDLAANVRRGRAGFLRQFSGLQDPTAVASIPDPCSHQTFLRCKLDHLARGPAGAAQERSRFPTGHREWGRRRHPRPRCPRAPLLRPRPRRSAAARESGRNAEIDACTRAAPGAAHRPVLGTHPLDR
jgi:maltooligosyltrehalose trehalohydrolase